MAELIKVHSLPGADVIEKSKDFRHPNDFLYKENEKFKNRDFIALVAGVKWVKFWVSWHRVQGSFPPPGDIWTSWSQLHSAGNENGNYFLRLDELIKAGSDAGLGVILQVDQSFPAWSSTSNFNRAGTGGKPREQVFPDSVATDSPWGWWISYLICRYRLNVPANNDGPTQSNLYGNPSGAALYGIEFCNEPNWYGWPISEAGCWTAEMFKSIEFIAAIHWPYSSGFGGVVLGPGTADTTSTNNVRPYDLYTKEVLSYLPVGWQPRVYIGWSHHNYGDIDDTLPPTNGNGSARAERVLGRLLGGFPGDTNNPWRNGDRNVYITEGAPRQNAASPAAELTGTQETNQVTMTRKAFLRVRYVHNVTGAFPTYAQHELNDVTTDATKYSPHRNFNYTTWKQGAERPLGGTWRKLPN
jgi:hypothetical protein